MTRRFRRASAAGGAGAAAGLAIATLVLPQLTDIAGPTPVLTLLVTVLLALVGAGVQRFNAHDAVVDAEADRRGAQAAALRVWPAPLRAVRRDTLGVFPASDPVAYRARPQDATVAEILSAGRPLLILGGPGVGKSRTAAEAARRVIGDVQAVVPVDCDGLRWLIDNDPELGAGVKDVVLWLDGLDRFLSALTPSTLRSFATVTDPRVRLVATLRTELWNELLAGTGQRSETARAVRQAFEVVELDESWETYPPPTAAPAGSAPGPEPEPADDPAPPDPGPRSPWRDRGLRGLAALAVLVLAGGIVVGLVSHGRSLVKPPSIADQMTTTIHQLIHGGRHVVVNERVRLHSTEDDSWLVVTEDGVTGADFYTGATGGPGDPRSDEVRIYDVKDGWLRLMLDFRPAGHGRTARAYTLPAGAPPALDYNDDGTQEIIAGYEAPDAHEELVPFVIDWEDSAYHLISMTPVRPQLSTAGFGTAVNRLRADLYLTPARLTNAVAGSDVRSIVGYQVQTFALVQIPTVRLLTGYYAQMPPQHAGQPTVLEIRANQVHHSDLQALACGPDTPSCPAPAHEQDAIIPPAKSLGNGLLQAWDLRGARWGTPVSLRTSRRWECLAAASSSPTAATGCPLASRKP